MTQQMAQETVPAETATPRLAPHFRMRFDAARDHWVVLGPERMFVPDVIAAEILTRCDGATSIRTIVDDFAETYDAPRAAIADDVAALIGELAEKGVLVL